MLGYSTSEILSTQNTKPATLEKSKVILGIQSDELKAEDSPGVGKLLVGPNGPVDATAAAKVAAAGTMPNISTQSTSVNATKTQSTTLHHVTKQCILRCDCCSVTVNSQHQLDLHLNGNIILFIFTIPLSLLFEIKFTKKDFCMSLYTISSLCRSQA